MKNWLIDVALKQMGPSAIRGAILGAAGWLAAKNGLLSALGIVTDMASHTTVIHWDQLSVWAIAGLPAAGAAVIKMLNYHGVQAVKSTTPGESQ